MSPRTRRVLSAVASLVLLVVVLVASRNSDDGSTSVATSTADTTAAVDTTSVPDQSQAPAEPDESLETATSATSAASVGSTCVDGDVETIDVDELPDEAIDTLELIESDGPFPYDQDGSTFQNRERLLPLHERGYYEEYTVETPGSDDRGARRIVAGDCGERWYTDDHYDSFSLIVGEP